jgi:hypothetical protein
MKSDYTAAEMAFLSTPTRLHPALAARLRVVDMQRTGGQITYDTPAPITPPAATKDAQPLSDAAKRAEQWDRMCGRAYQRNQAEQAQKSIKESQK